MRVAAVSNIPSPYRSPWFDALAEVGDLELTVVYLGAGHPKRRAWAESPARHRRVVLSSRVIEVGEDALHLSLRAGRVLGALDPDVVLIGGWDQPFFWSARRWARRAGAAFVPVVESHARSGRLRRGPADRVRGRFLAGAAGVVAMSDDARAFVRHLGFDGPVVVDPHTVAPPERIPARPDPAGSLRLLVLGRVSRRKNPRHVLRVAAALARRGRRVVVDVVGDGAEPELVADPPAGIEVEVWGHLLGSALEERWAAATCLVTPSLADPGPMVLAEAAARGVPFVASDRCGAAATLLGLGANGRTLALEEPVETWADAVLEIAERPRTPLTAVLPEGSVTRVAAFLRSVSPTIGR